MGGFNPPPAAGRGNRDSGRSETGAGTVSIRPRPLAGGIAVAIAGIADQVKFQSAPGRWPGESRRREVRRRARQVSIRPRPAGRGNRGAGQDAMQDRSVSIRPRPLAGGISPRGHFARRTNSFQSAPGRWPGESRASPRPRLSPSRFNPPPAAGRGNRRAAQRSRPPRSVSIRPRPLAGGISRRPSATAWKRWCFNPPPARWPGESTAWPPAASRWTCFNPPPAAGRGNRGGSSAGAERRAVSIRPRPLAGGIGDSASGTINIDLFQSAPGRWPGESPCRRRRPTSRSGRVSIRPRPLAGGIAEAPPVFQPRVPVSIRPRPLAGGIAASCTPNWTPTASFNPPPAAGRGNRRPPRRRSGNRPVSIRPRPLAGGNASPRRSIPILQKGFQSAPGRWPGESVALIENGLRAAMFQSAPGPLAGGILRCVWESARDAQVSIRPRPLAGGIIATLPSPCASRRSFNPPPARWPGESSAGPTSAKKPSCFNPPPAAGRGNHRHADGLRGLQPVSIRPRPLAGGIANTARTPTATGCFNPPPARWPGETRAAARPRPGRPCFNPPPARWPGESAWTSNCSRPICKFQSAPGPLAGGILTVTGSIGGVANSFNPPPAAGRGNHVPPHAVLELADVSIRPRPLAGGIGYAWTLTQANEGVSIRPRPAGRGNLALFFGFFGGACVSIRPRPAGRGNLGCAPRTCSSVIVSIRPRPAGRGNRAVMELSRGHGEVSIRPRPAGRGNRPAPRASRARQACFNPPPARWPGESSWERS